MTTAVLTPPTSAAAGPVLHSSLDAELAAILAGETGECLVCGEPVETEAGRVECCACGSTLRPAREPGADQLALV